MASRSEGFAVMDVSTSILQDPKFRRIQREAPDQVATAFTAYVATIAESWKAGRRVAIDDAWPAILPYSETAVEVMQTVKLLDSGGRIASKSWRDWFDTARSRRDAARDRWRRSNEKRHDDAASPPRGSSADTDAIRPSVRPSDSVRPSEPSDSENGFTAKPRSQNGRARTAAGNPS